VLVFKLILEESLESLLVCCVAEHIVEVLSSWEFVFALHVHVFCAMSACLG